jgi:hypothetical protein
VSSRGTTVVVLNPHEIGKGVRARVRPNLGEDYGVEVRQAAVARQRQERVNRAYDDAEARRAEAERQRILELTQKTYDKAAVAQANILVAGQNQFRRFVSVGSVFAFLVVGAVTVSSILSKPNKGSSNRSRRKSKRRSRTKAATAIPAWSPASS